MRILIAMLAALVALQQRPSAPLVPRFENGEAQPVFAGDEVIRDNVWVPIANLDTDRDGEWDRIRLQVHRPAATDRGTRLPVVLIASPYAGGTLPYPRHDVDVPLFVPAQRPPAILPPLPRPDLPRYDGTEPPIRDIRASSYESYFLPRGFVFAYANSLGTGQSTGCPTIGGREENLAIKAAIDWLNGRARGYDAAGRPLEAHWTTGATTMIGTSYDGTLPIGAATLGIDGLKAIVPIAGVSSYYDHRRSYGLVIHSNPVIGTDADTLFDNILSRKHPEACAHMRARIAHDIDRQTGDYNAFWDERNYVTAIGASFRAAVLIQHGLNDLNTKPRHAARLWQALAARRVPAKIWWHQGGHGDRANQARQVEWRTMLNRFWTHHLFGVPNGVMEGPKALIERENHDWVAYADWPLPSAARSIVGLTPGDGDAAGTLSPGRDRPSTPLQQQIFVDDASVDAEVLASAPVSPHRLVFQTPAIAAPVHVSGVPEVSLRLSFSAPAAIVSAMLIDYRASGAPVIISRGWADPQNRESIARTVPIEPGVPYTISFELQPHDYIFAAGSRIGLMVLSSDRLFTLRPPPGTRLTLHPAESALTLPVVGGPGALAGALRRR
jgi:X-Pro dipeptidyl-peptidase